MQRLSLSLCSEDLQNPRSLRTTMTNFEMTFFVLYWLRFNQELCFCVQILDISNGLYPNRNSASAPTTLGIDQYTQKTSSAKSGSEDHYGHHQARRGCGPRNLGATSHCIWPEQGRLSAHTKLVQTIRRYRVSFRQIEPGSETAITYH